MAKVLRILAFAGAIGAGILCIVLAVTQRTPALYAWAAVAFFGGITGFIFGTGGEPSGSIDPPKLGGKFTGLPDWLTVTDMILVVIAFVISFVL
ncbi:hypothetical protein [Sphingomonas sp. DT-204]|uniref:hypothetical protein n=1 Tax=Sphingomonas sp. DT-204 TaxID=3396166 RepID=UPI003F1E239D